MTARLVNLAFLCLGVVGCKSLNGSGPLSWTWTKERGVCARVDTSAFFRDGAASACARTRPAGETFEPFLYSELSTSDGGHWRPEDWRVRVLRPDGTVLLDGPVAMRRQLRPCMVLYGVVHCTTIMDARIVLSERWRTGTYPIRYTYVPVGREVDLSLTLE